jgi:hypothetical protein
LRRAVLRVKKATFSRVTVMSRFSTWIRSCNRGEVQDAGHAGGHQLLGDVLGLFGRNRDDRDVDAFLVENLGHLPYRVAMHVGEGQADLVEIDVEGRDQADLLHAVGQEGGDGPAQVAHAHDGHWAGFLRIEEGGQRAEQALDLVAAVGIAAVADGHEIAAHLCRRKSTGVRELVRVHTGAELVAVVEKRSPVDAQSFDAAGRDLAFLHGSVRPTWLAGLPA